MNKIKEFRKKKNLSQSDIAKIINVKEAIKCQQIYAVGQELSM